MFKEYPLLVAANRDERYDRPSAAPTVWPTDPRIFAGKDLLAGGTWLGVNEAGLVAGILNRRSTTESQPTLPTRSRGLLCLDLLRLESAPEASTLIRRLEESYQPFTALFADPREAWVATNTRGEIKTYKLNEGLHVLSNAAQFDGRSEKVDRAYLQFAGALEDPRLNGRDPTAWVRSLQTVLADHSLGNGSDDPREAICVHGDVSGTVSSTVIIYSEAAARYYAFNCPGPPCQRSFGEALALVVR